VKARLPIVDTGPLVALLDSTDRHHQWAVGIFSELRGPLLSCEAVLAEVLFLCGRNRLTAEPIHLLLERGTLRVAPVLADAPREIVRLLRQYRSVPMSLADGCILHLHETTARSVVVTCDRDFGIYRRSRRRAVDALVPWGR